MFFRDSDVRNVNTQHVTNETELNAILNFWALRVLARAIAVVLLWIAVAIAGRVVGPTLIAIAVAAVLRFDRSRNRIAINRNAIRNAANRTQLTAIAICGLMLTVAAVTGYWVAPLRFQIADRKLWIAHPWGATSLPAYWIVARAAIVYVSVSAAAMLTDVDWAARMELLFPTFRNQDMTPQMDPMGFPPPRGVEFRAVPRSASQTSDNDNVVYEYPIMPTYDE